MSFAMLLLFALLFGLTLCHLEGVGPDGCEPILLSVNGPGKVYARKGVNPEKCEPGKV